MAASATAGVLMAADRVDSCLRYYDVGFDIPGDSATRVAAEFHWPQGRPSPLVWFCLPGGAMNRHFYDLYTADDSFSFARQMTARGFVCVLIDPPGIGDSDHPEDGYALTPERLVSVLARVHGEITADLRAGRISAELPALEQAMTIGLGHSMGALLTVLQQAQGRPHAGLALLGFGTQGLPEYLPPEAREAARDTKAVRARLVSFARQMFGQPYPDIKASQGGDIYGSAGADRQAVEALKRARDRLLPVPAFMSILPGNVAPEAAGIDVPVYLVLGENDLVEPSVEPKAGFHSSPAVEQQLLPQTGHSFFLFESRSLLFDSLTDWARGLGD